MSRHENGTENEFQHIKGVQRKMMEMATLPVNPNMKRTETLNALSSQTLHQCARDGDAATMEALLEGIPPQRRVKKINEHDEESLGPLHYAARYFHLPIVKLLIKYGADVNDPGEDYLAPLHFASRCRRALRKADIEDTEESQNERERSGSGGGAVDDHLQTNLDASDDEAHVEDAEGTDMSGGGDGDGPSESSSVVHCLVKNGARINQPDKYGLTPLHMAAMRGNDVACHDLLYYSKRNKRYHDKYTLNIEARDKQDMTALHFAATHNQQGIVEMLIRAGASITAIDDEYSTALHLAAAEGHLHICNLLLGAAERQGEWQTVSELLCARDVDGSTPLLLAVENGNYKTAKLCIAKGADVNTYRADNNTCLHLAAVAGDIDTIKLLVENNALIDVINQEHATPLHRAAAHNHKDVVRYLVEKNAYLERHDRDHYTPLLLAAVNGHADAIETLLELGADVKASEKNDKTALFLTAEENKPDALKVLIENDDVISNQLIDTPDRYFSTPLHVAAESGNDDCVEILMDNQANLSAKDEDEKTPLHLAAEKGRTYVVRQLIKYGEKMRNPIVNDEDESSNTPLHLAALEGHEKVCKALLENSAAVDARNCNNWTPLDCAASGGHIKTCRLLIDFDAPIDPLDRNKQSPLHLAASYGHVDVVKLLIEKGADVAQRSIKNRNCLDLAIDKDRKEAASAIIASPKWRSALSNRYVDPNGHITTPLRKLILKMPDVAEEAFTKCITANDVAPEQRDYELTFLYEFLDDMYSNWQSRFSGDSAQADSVSITTEMFTDYALDDIHVHPEAKPYIDNKTILKHNHPLKMMVTAKRENLLAHPLVTMLLRHKWNSFGRYVYYINLTIYCVFLFFLTGYILVARAPFQYNKEANLQGDLIPYVPSRNCSDIQNLSATESVFDLKPKWAIPTFIIFGKWLLIGMFVFFVIREMLQMYNSKWHYIGFENMLEWVMYVSSMLLVVDFCPASATTGIRMDWQWQAGAVAIFLAWMDLVLFIRKFPRFGIYVVMFTDILKTFLRFFVVFFLFIIAFSLAFYVLLNNQKPFDEVGYAMIKTMVMMIGEYEFDSIFNEERGEGKDNFHQHVYYDKITLVLFVVFMILMSIIIMNLLVGLAVDDIKAVQEQAVLKRLAMQVELALDVESMLPMFWRRRTIIRLERVKPNVPTFSRKFREFFHMSESKISSSAIASALNPDLDEFDRIIEKQKSLQAQVKDVKSRVKAMNESVNRIETMMETLLEKQSITWEEEDDTESH